MKVEFVSDELYHHGVPGMKWGQRKRQILKGYRTDKGPKRGKVLNASNSAARSHFRADRALSYRRFSSQNSKARLKEGRLTSEQVKNGRYRVARARSIKRNAASVGVGALAGGALAATVATGGAAGLAILGGIGATGISHFISGAHYYGKQRKAYGGTRAKYQNKAA